MAILIVAAFAICAFALDIAHICMVRSELQSACDAGSLAGARELAKDSVSNPTDIDRAILYAETVMSVNSADNQRVSIPSTATTSDATPRASNQSVYYVKTSATRTVNNIFARTFGNQASVLYCESTAYAVKSVNPLASGQVFPLAVSLDWSPPSGPQQGKPLNSYVGPDATIRPFTVSLNSQQKKNGAWIVDWNSSEASPPIVFGQTVANLTNGVQANVVQTLQPGETIFLPVITGGPPMNDNRTIVGVVGFKIDSVNFPQDITGKLIQPVILRGTPGATFIPPNASSQDLAFINQNSNWKVALYK